MAQGSSTSRSPTTVRLPTRNTCGWPRATRYSPDFKELTIKTRSGVKWSDGTPFSADDVTYTLNSLKELGPKVRWGVDVQQFMQEARTTAPNTVVIKFKVPAPRFFYFMTYKYDIGVYIGTKHVFQQMDWHQVSP